MNFSETSGPIAIKFYLTHHWGGGDAALCFGPDRIGILVSMGYNGGIFSTLAPSILIFFILAGKEDNLKI